MTIRYDTIEEFNMDSKAKTLMLPQDTEDWKSVILNVRKLNHTGSTVLIIGQLCVLVYNH